MPVTPYGPRHAAAPTRPAGAPPSEGTSGTGLAAILRRSPHRVQQAAVGAIGAGVVLFVVASVATASTGGGTKPAAAAAGAPTGAAVAATTTSSPASAPQPGRPISAGAARISAKDLSAEPVTSTRQAPAGRKVISGLAANGIPNVALNAYRVAAARLAAAQPSCGIDWAMLAGIGREESDHGRFAGAVLHSDGTSTPQIVGPALDGVHSDYIAAPADGAALDGDSRYTHALGPMQFIPQTWARYGADANGDGTADIFNVNDAALGAARYLCAAGGNLRTQSGRVAAVLAYNHNTEYLAQVLALAQAYRTGVRVTGVPVGRLTGALPPISAGGLLPVNPGVPTAVGALTGGSDGGGGGAGGADKAGSSEGGTTGTTAQPTPGRGSPPARHSTPPAPSAPASGASSARPTRGSTSPRPTSAGSSSASSSSGGSGGHPGGGSGSGGGTTPTPTPTPTCRVGLGGTCIIP